MSTAQMITDKLCTCKELSFTVNARRLNQICFIYTPIQIYEYMNNEIKPFYIPGEPLPILNSLVTCVASGNGG